MALKQRWIQLKNLLDIPVDYYVRMNFDAFTEVVDALGGIEANVPYPLRKVIQAIIKEPSI